MVPDAREFAVPEVLNREKNLVSLTGVKQMQHSQHTRTDRGSLGMAVTLLLLTMLVLMVFFIIANPTIIMDQVETFALS